MPIPLLPPSFGGGPISPAGTSLFIRIDALLSGSWTDITNDVSRGTIRHFHGIDGNDPLDVVAGSGELHFMMQNFAKGSRPLGYYSPGHANVRTGWGYNVDVRVVYIYTLTEYIRWTGKIKVIDPDADPNGRRCVTVVAYDRQHDLVDAIIRSISPQVGQTEDTLINAVLDALPTSAQPSSRDIAAGVDIVPLAFDRIGKQQVAVTALADVVRSGLGTLYTTGAGVCTYKTRQERYSTASSATLDDAANIDSFSGPTSRSGSYNCVRVTYHPKHTAATTLWSYTGSTPQVVYPGQTITVWTEYRDPDQSSVLIGASAITEPDAGTDYIAYEFDDATGTLLTSALTVSTNRYATTTEWTIANTGTIAAYLTTWQLRGTGIFDDGEQTVEAGFGDRVLTLDLPYQQDRHVAYGMAQLIKDQRENPINIPTSVGFVAQRSATLIDLALTVEPSDVITVSNTYTGVSSATCAVQRIEYEVNPAGKLHVQVALSPITTVTTPPSVPSGLAVSTYSDTELTAAWTNTDVTAETELYVDGGLATIAGPGATTVTLAGLTRATNYTVTAKHVKYALMRSSATTGVIGRPTVIATGGSTVDTFVDTGVTYRRHMFTLDASFGIAAAGRLNYALLGGGGGGGASDAFFIGGGGAGGGEVLIVYDNQEPAGTYAVVVGPGGAGAVSSIDVAGIDGGDTTYRSSAGQGGGGGGSFISGVGGSHNGNSRGSGGGGSGEGGLAGVGDLGGDGGNGGAAGSGYRTGGGGGGVTGNGSAGVTGGTGSAVGGAGASGYVYPMYAGGIGGGGQGGGPAGATGANGPDYGYGGTGNINGDGGDGMPGFAIFWYPI